MIELHTLYTLEALDNAKHTTEKDGFINDQGLRPYQSKMIKSIIDSRTGTVKSMISASKIFSLNVNTKIDNRIAKKITKAGFSRIPVYEKNDKNKIIGIMLIKTLIGLDLSEGKTISELVNAGEVVLRKPIFVSPHTKFEELLHFFLMGKSHMAIVSDNPQMMEEYVRSFEDVAGELSMLVVESSRNETEPSAVNNKNKGDGAEVLGLITLEDLIEYIIKEDILDEADYDRDLSRNKDPHVRVDRSFFLEGANISAFIKENREKIRSIVGTQVETEIRRKKFRFRPEATRSNLCEASEAVRPLLDKSLNYTEKELGNHSHIN